MAIRPPTTRHGARLREGAAAIGVVYGISDNFAIWGLGRWRVGGGGDHHAGFSWVATAR
jgi:hypothetical protein